MTTTLLQLSLALITLVGDYNLYSFPQKEEGVVQVKHEVYVIVFTAEWCNPCKRQKSNLYPSLSKSGYSIGLTPRHVVRICDVDANEEFAKRFKIKSVPTWVLIVKGFEKSRLEGEITTVKGFQKFSGLYPKRE